jgi:CHAD domain-containing protein/CYTH domain-containing protein
MELPQTLVDLPASEGARRLALTHLEAARAARTRVATSVDPEALHDYRVALRRLRSCFRSYRPELRSTVTRKSRRRLDRIARATNRSRDLEVHLDWLVAQAAAAEEPERPGIEWLTAQFEQAQSREREAMLALDERLFSSLYQRLSRQLRHYPLTVRLDQPEEPPTTATVAAQHLERAARLLDERLRLVQGETGEMEIHRARIAAKHLRYLLEPFAGSLPGGDTLVERLKGLQDAFGDVHDAHVFLPALRTAQADTERDLRMDLGPGLRSLARSLRARALEAFGIASKEWLDPAWRASYFEEVRAAGQALVRRPRPGREVERKYLLSGLPPAAMGAPSVEIEQGYLPGERLVERLRRISGEEGVELVRTMKEGSGLVRLEVEESVAPEVFDALWPLTAGRRLLKRRYRVAAGDLIWEIDQFLDRDLVLAEVELPAPEVEVAVPDWLGPWVQREVTDDPAYDNVELSRSPGLAFGHAGAQ